MPTAAIEASPAVKSPDHRWLVLAILGIARLMVVLDATVVNIALPSAQEALHFSDSAHQCMCGRRRPAPSRSPRRPSGRSQRH